MGRMEEKSGQLGRGSWGEEVDWEEMCPTAETCQTKEGVRLTQNFSFFRT